MNSSVVPDIKIVASRYASLDNNYIISAICSFGIVTNIICCIVFLLPKFKIKIYQFLFWKSFFHLAGLLIQVFTPVIYSSSLGNTYATTLYRWVFRTWVYNSFCMAALFCNLAVSFDRLIMISKKCDCFLSRVPVLVLLVAFFVFSLACFFFPLFTYYIAPGSPEYYPDGGAYQLYYTEWGRSLGNTIVRITMFSLRDIVLWILFVVVNVILLYEARKVFRRKANMTAATVHVVSGTLDRKQSDTPLSKSKGNKMSNQAERRMTNMTVVMSAVLAFGQMPYAITIIMWGVWYSSSTDYTNGISVMLNHLAFDMLYFSFGVSIFIYYFFDKNFKTTIDDFFKKILSYTCSS